MISEFRMMSAFSQSLAYAGASLDSLQKDKQLVGMVLLARPKSKNCQCYSRIEGQKTFLPEAIAQAMFHDTTIAEALIEAIKIYRSHN